MIASSILGFVVSGLLIGKASSEAVDLRGGKKFCFYDNLAIGAHWGFQYQADDDKIHVDIMSPSAKIFEERKNYGSYAFTASENGKHVICITNTNGVGTPSRKVSFSMLGSATDTNAPKSDPILVEIGDLNAGLRAVRDEQEFLLQRERQHKEIAASTNRRVMWWFLFQLFLLGGVSYFQIYYLKRFFEVRRVV